MNNKVYEIEMIKDKLLACERLAAVISQISRYFFKPGNF
jgi:hypothetical protein